MRRDAAKALGELGDTRAVGPLTASLRDSHAHVSAEAAIALGKLGDTRAVEPLIGFLHSERATAKALRELKHNALSDLSYTGLKAVENLVKEHAHVRASAVEALAKLGDSRAVEPLIASLEDDDADVRFSAARTLGELGDARAVEPLAARLGVYGAESFVAALAKLGAIEQLIACVKDWNTNDAVRVSAAEALGDLGDVRATEALVVALGRGRNPDAVVAALMKLDAMDALIACVKDSNMRDARVSAVMALLRSGNSLDKLSDAWAVEPLIDCLSYTDQEKERCLAASALGKTGDARAVEPLIDCLKDACNRNYGDTEASAVEALAELGQPAVEPLVACLNDRRVQPSAAEALNRLLKTHVVRAVKPLIACLRHQKTGFNAYCELVRLGEPAVEPLIACLQRSSGKEEELAARALGELGAPRALEPLFACFRRDWSVREGPASSLITLGKALSKVGDRRVLEQLLCCLRDAGPGRCGAAGALGKLGDVRAVEPLIACLKDQDGNLRLSAAEALGELGDSRAVKPLIAYWNEGNQHEYARKCAGRAMFRLGDTLVKSGDARAAELLVVCLKGEDWEVRDSAAKVLAKLGNAAFESVIASLRDEHGKVRLASVSALGDLGDKRAVEPLIACLRDRDKYARSAAAAALGKLGDKRGVEPLIGYLKDHDEDARRSAVYALGDLGDHRALNPLIVCLKDESGSVREAAAASLARLGDMRALLERLSDWNTKESAGNALKQLGWKPATNSELVYSWISNGDGTSLKANWEMTTVVLLGDVRSRNQRKVEYAVYSFMSLGKDEIIRKLVDILNDEGHKEMAEIYLNCGHDRLAKAARSWASAHGYQISTRQGSANIIWGTW